MCPDTQNSLVPADFSVPHWRYQAAPLLTMCGTVQSVSTLLMVEGLPKAPETAGKGGLSRGSPRRPSSEFISPVSSPQMYAPAPRCRVMSRSIPRSEEHTSELQSRQYLVCRLLLDQNNFLLRFCIFTDSEHSQSDLPS